MPRISEVEVELAQAQDQALAQTSTAQSADRDRAASEGAPEGAPDIDAGSRLAGALGRISELEAAADELRRSSGRRENIWIEVFLTGS